MKENNAYVYRHRRFDTNEIFYIGIGSTFNYKRAHTKDGRNKHWHNIVNKYGYQVEIIQDKISWEDACELEMFLIEWYGRKDLGKGNLVNMTDGGEGTLGTIATEEYRRKSSERVKGHKNIMFGKTHTKEAREKIRKSQIGRIKTLEQREAMSKRMRDNPINFTKEIKEKLSKANSGENNGMYGRTYGSNPRARPVINQITGEKYSCVKEASESLKIGFSSLYAYLTGARPNKTNLKFY